tara:strand:- start:2681 stop:4819 length:2139 start_codon:yes stop_codon:yes gene_type:complete
LFVKSVITAQGGLTFISNDKPKNERTRYQVFENDLKFKNSLEVSFDLSFYSPLFIGEIMTVSNETNNTDFSLYYKYTYKDENESFIQINRRGEKKLYEEKIPDHLIINRTWIKVRINFDFVNNKIDFDFNGNKISIFENFDNPEDKFNITFGKNDIYFDVPSIKIKNLEIASSNLRLSFPLNQKEGNDVYDETLRHKGFVENPYWLIGDFYHWKPEKSFLMPTSSEVIYDENKSNFYLLSDSYLLRYNILENKVDSIPYVSPPNFVTSLTAKGILDNKNNSIIVYRTSMNQMINNDLLIQKLGLFVDHKKTRSISEERKKLSTIASLDLETFKWENIDNQDIFDDIRFHNNTILNTSNNSLLMFGGYSNFNYHNDFIQYDLSQKTSSNVVFSGDKISPRFYAGHLKSSNDKLLLYGGVGNLSGEEHIGKKYFDDLYEVDLAERVITKKWSRENSLLESASSENLVLSKDKLSFFNISFKENYLNTSIKLKKVKIEDGSVILLGDSIPFRTNKFPNKIDLFQLKNNNRLVLYKKEFVDNKSQSNRVSFYSIEFEPVTVERFNQGQAVFYGYWFYVYLFLGITTLILTCLFIFLRKKHLSSRSKIKESSRDYIFVRANRQNIKLSMDDICAVEALKDYIKIVCEDKNYIVHNNLSKFFEQLPKQKFIRIHRSFIINVNKITSLDGDVIYLERKHYKIGGKYIEELKVRLNITKV